MADPREQLRKVIADALHAVGDGPDCTCTVAAEEWVGLADAVIALGEVTGRTWLTVQYPDSEPLGTFECEDLADADARASWHLGRGASCEITQDEIFSVTTERVPAGPS